jgi:hypothetical protein
MPSSYQVVLWKQESFVVLRPLQIEFFRNLLKVKFEVLSGTTAEQARILVGAMNEMILGVIVTPKG